MKLFTLIATLLVANPLAAQELPDMPKPKPVVVRQADAWPPKPLVKEKSVVLRRGKLFQLFVYAAPIAASAIATHEANECRVRNGVAPCAGGYGGFAGREGLRMGVAVLFSGLSWYGHRAGFKEWSGPALGYAGFNTVVAVKESRVNVQREKE